MEGEDVLVIGLVGMAVMFALKQVGVTPAPSACPPAPSGAQTGSSAAPARW